MFINTSPERYAFVIDMEDLQVCKNIVDRLATYNFSRLINPEDTVLVVNALSTNTKARIAYVKTKLSGFALEKFNRIAYNINKNTITIAA
jgi:hypothetical protein